MFRVIAFFVISLIISGCDDSFTHELDCDTGTVTMNELFGCKLSNDYYQYGFHEIENYDSYELAYYKSGNPDDNVIDVIIRAHNRNHIDSLEFLIDAHYKGVSYDSWEDEKPNIISSSASFEVTGRNAIGEFALEFMTIAGETCFVSGFFDLRE